MALFKTSKEAREILSNFQRKTGIRPNLWARAAFGYSLSLESEPEKVDYDSEGSEFPEKVFFGNDEEVLLALLRQKLRRIPADSEIGPIIKDHVERGIRYFQQELQKLNSVGDEFLIYLLEQCPKDSEFTNNVSLDLLPKSISPDNYIVNIELGKDINTNEMVCHNFNSPGTSPHIAIMGRNGTGKTRTGLSFLNKIGLKSSYPIPFLIFDYAKGDIAENRDFVKSSKALVIRLPEDRIPMTPLSLLRYDEFAVQMAARRFRDTICSVVHLGPVQKDRCLQFITRLYKDFGNKTPDLIDLTKLAQEEYDQNGWKSDSLIACLKEFSTFPLFRSASDGEKHDFFKASHIIDIHNLPEDLRKLTSFLILDRLYSEIMSLPDAPLDKNSNRQLRLIIVIDEAHHYLPCRQPTLENMVREVRSKGVAIWLFSQSPDDFDQSRYNFAREMGLSLVFSCVLERPKMLEALIGGKINPANLSKLTAGVALTRAHGSDNPIKIRAWGP